jgi:hypothetical protein
MLAMPDASQASAPLALATTPIVANTGSLSSGAKWIVALEFLLSIVWAMVGGVGRRRALAHREDLDEAGERWARAAGLENYKPVGSGQNVVWVGVLAPVCLTIGWAGMLVFLRLN